jgi:PAS domain S-box-containing protein
MNSDNNNGKILIVDDEEIVHLTLKRILVNEGYTIDSVYGGKEALELLDKDYDLIICDIRMPDMDGIEVLRQLRKRDLPVEVIMLTGLATLESTAQAMNYGARSFLMKPIDDIPEFRRNVSETVCMAQLNRDNKIFYDALMSGQVDSAVIKGKPMFVPTLRQEMKELLQRLIQVIGDGIVLLDHDGIITFTNIKFAQNIGDSLHNIIGKPFKSYIVDNEREMVIEVFTRLASGQSSNNIQTNLKTRFGGTLNVIMNCAPVYYEKEYRGVALVISDVTEMNKVREKVDLLANLVENAQYDMIFILKPDGKIIECNALARNTFGYTQSEMLSKNLGDLLKTESGEKWNQIRDTIEHNLQCRDEFVVLNTKGREISVEMTISMSLSPVNKQVYIICFMRDITERKLAEKAAEELGRYAESIVETVREPLLVMDANLNIISASRNFYKSFKTTPEDTIGKFIYDLGNHQWDIPALRTLLEDILPKETKFENFEVKHDFQTLGNKTMLLNAREIRREDIGTKTILLAIEDITERKRMEEKLEKILADFGRSNVELEQFAYVASHDLQEPLRMVTSFTQLLEKRYKNKLDRDADEFIGFIVDGALRMQSMINDLLQYSRIGTRGKPFIVTDFESILNQALINLKVTIEENNAIITHDPLPTLMADPSQMTQVFQNLLSNAIKFRSKEMPRVHVSAQKKEKKWIFSLRDNGIGIAPEFFEKLFILFQRLHSKSEYPGTGIGLAVCKKIVERHGGKIWVESETGKGSTFYFTIPVSQGEYGYG